MLAVKAPTDAPAAKVMVAKAVPFFFRVRVTVAAGAVAGRSAQHSNRSIFKGKILPLLRWEEPVRRPPPAEIDTKPFEKYWRQRNLTGNTAFGLSDKDDHPLAVYVSDL